MPTQLEALTADLNGATVGALGDTIFYTPASGGEVEILAFVDEPETVSFGGSTGAVAQDLVVEAFASAIPVRPTDTCRVRISGRTETFKPVSVRQNEDRTGWLFELKKVAV